MTLCPICNRTDETQVLRRYQAGGVAYRLHECSGCTVEWWEPRLGPGPEFYSTEGLSMYTHIHAGRRTALTDERFRRFFDRLAKQERVRVLDVGCGSGDFLEEVAIRGNEAWGIDFDQVSISRARARGLSKVWCTPLEDFVKEHRGVTFDHVTAFDVVEHLTDPRQVLETLREQLTPRGWLTMTVPNRNRILANQMISDYPPHHFFRFDRDSLVHTLKHAGFTNVTVEVFQYGYALPTAVNFLSKRVKTLRKRLQNESASPGIPLGDPTPESRNAGNTRSLALRLLAAATIPSAYLERAFGRGFKIMATARRS